MLFFLSWDHHTTLESLGGGKPWYTLSPWCVCVLISWRIYLFLTHIFVGVEPSKAKKRLADRESDRQPEHIFMRQLSSSLTIKVYNYNEMKTMSNLWIYMICNVIKVSTPLTFGQGHTEVFQNCFHSEQGRQGSIKEVEFRCSDACYKL